MITVLRQNAHILPPTIEKTLETKKKLTYFTATKDCKAALR